MSQDTLPKRQRQSSEKESCSFLSPLASREPLSLSTETLGSCCVVERVPIIQTVGIARGVVADVK